jgi:uncharacterized membrane protein
MRNFLLSDFLSALSVPHTRDYTDRRFGSMPFKSLFGLSKLLEEYGVESEGLFMRDKEELSRLTPPFLAHTPQGFLIVTAIGEGNVQYLTQGVAENIPLQEFRRVWDGNVFLAFPSPGAAEPDYAAHARMRFFGRAKKVMLLVLAVLLFAWLFITNGIWRHASLILATVCDLLGLGLTYLLVQKSMKIKSRAAERVCGVLQEGGCDTVLETKASSFFGIFSWSEVGFTYFSVSLLALLMFPSAAPWLAACNVCCLPFTVWSIWYQKFRAKAWCTLCVSVQATLWLLFACYISGGWLREVFPLRADFFVLGATYAFVLLLINTLTRVLRPAAPADAPSTSDPVK